jgi:DNA invertase Pin-like site-specific DNA recombinase
MKVAIYARYSSDNQRDASIADQLRICREFAARQAWTVITRFGSAQGSYEGSVLHGFGGTRVPPQCRTS